MGIKIYCILACEVLINGGGGAGCDGSIVVGNWHVQDLGHNHSRSVDLKRNSLMATPNNPFSFDDDASDGDEGGWQEMPVVKEDEFASGLDMEDQQKYHYVPKKTVSHAHSHSGGNATGNLIDFDDKGSQWRSKTEQNENEYTRLRGDEEDETDEVHLRTRYLFDEDKAMTPLGQMQTTKKMLTEAQRIAYVGLCALTAKEMMQRQKNTRKKEFKNAIHSMELWALKVMGRLYYHMDLEIAGILFVILTLVF